MSFGVIYVNWLGRLPGDLHPIGDVVKANFALEGLIKRLKVVLRNWLVRIENKVVSAVDLRNLSLVDGRNLEGESMAEGLRRLSIVKVHMYGTVVIIDGVVRNIFPLVIRHLFPGGRRQAEGHLDLIVGRLIDYGALVEKLQSP